MSAVDVSVVIPTRDRETRLRFALEALAEQTLDPSRFEVIVVRAPGARPPFCTAPEGLEVRFMTAATAGPAAQRNHGWRAADAPLVAFTDDDCRPLPPWLESLLAAARAEAIVEGRTRPDPDELHLLTGLARSVDVDGPSPWYPSCNLALPRALLERLDGFDESFAAPWGEDTDLGLRALEAGARLSFSERAEVLHAVVSRSLARALSEATRRRWIPLVIARHPSQRSELYRGLFLNRGHAALAAGLLVALALRRRPRLATPLAAAPYVALNATFYRPGPGRRLRGLPRFAAQLTGRLAIDLVEVGSAALGSARHRAPVI